MLPYSWGQGQPSGDHLQDGLKPDILISTVLIPNCLLKPFTLLTLTN
jgi:hypothetical protein